jgi:hypothetical protein
VAELLELDDRTTARLGGHLLNESLVSGEEIEIPGVKMHVLKSM